MKIITIITATYNAQSCLENLIQSIIPQKNDSIEFIIIDGKSKDNTVNIIKKYEDIIDYWISEPDKGIYDAWNKGIEKAKGDWIMFLGADDKLEVDALNIYKDFIIKKSNIIENIDYISSKVQMIDVNGKNIRIKGRPFSWPLFLKEMTVAHPGSLHSRKLFEKYGNFDISYRIVGDYEFFLRPKNELKAFFIDRVTVKMSEGGASDSIAAIKEHYRAIVKTCKYPKYKAFLNALMVYSKYLIKKGFRFVGINVYLKK